MAVLLFSVCRNPVEEATLNRSEPKIPVRMALIGCGQIAAEHAAHIEQDSRVVLGAVYDPHLESVERFQQQWAPDAVRLSRLEEVGSLKEEIDACLICSPTNLHFAHARYCLESQFPVLCEKPLAGSREEIEELVQLSASSGLLLSVGYQRRSCQLYKTMLREVRSGQWGKVRAISGHIIEDWQQTIRGTWRDDPAHNRGGFIGDAGSHKIDSLFNVSGLEPVEVYAQTDCCGSQVEICAQVVARFTEDVTVCIDFVGNGQYFAEDIHLHCERADIMVRNEKVWLGHAGKLEEITDLEAHSSPVSDFVSALLGSGPNVAPPECALPVFDFTTAILESGRTGKRITLPV